jgi:integrase
MTLLDALERQIDAVRRQHLRDTVHGGGWVVARGTAAESGAVAVRQWRASWLFPAKRQHRDRVSGQWRRHHISATTLQRAIVAAAHDAGLTERITARTLRHACAMQLLRNGHDLYVVRDLLGHRDLSTTLRYLGGLDRRSTVRSPLDQLPRLSRASEASLTDARRSTD